MTILIVDDEEGIRESLAELFVDEGYEVVTAATGPDALASLAPDRRLPCVVILDLILPGIDGTEVYARMKEDPRLAGVPVIISTSDPGRAPAGSLIMRKPLDIDRLIETVRTFCPAPPPVAP